MELAISAWSHEIMLHWSLHHGNASITWTWAVNFWCAAVEKLELKRISSLSDTRSSFTVVSHMPSSKCGLTTRQTLHSMRLFGTNSKSYNGRNRKSTEFLIVVNFRIWKQNWFFANPYHIWKRVEYNFNSIQFALCTSVNVWVCFQSSQHTM